METEYGIDVFGSINCKCKFLKVMRNLCGKKATITDKYKEMISLTFDDIKEDNGWSFSTDMVELAYPTVRGCEVKEKVMKVFIYATDGADLMVRYSALEKYEDFYDKGKGSYHQRNG